MKKTLFAVAIFIAVLVVFAVLLWFGLRFDNRSPLPMNAHDTATPTQRALPTVVEPTAMPTAEPTTIAAPLRYEAIRDCEVSYALVKMGEVEAQPGDDAHYYITPDGKIAQWAAFAFTEESLPESLLDPMYNAVQWMYRINIAGSNLYDHLPKGDALFYNEWGLLAKWTEETGELEIIGFCQAPIITPYWTAPADADYIGMFNVRRQATNTGYSISFFRGQDLDASELYWVQFQAGRTNYDYGEQRLAHVLWFSELDGYNDPFDFESYWAFDNQPRLEITTARDERDLTFCPKGYPGYGCFDTGINLPENVELLARYDWPESAGNAPRSKWFRFVIPSFSEDANPPISFVNDVYEIAWDSYAISPTHFVEGGVYQLTLQTVQTESGGLTFGEAFDLMTDAQDAMGKICLDKMTGYSSSNERSVIKIYADASDECFTQAYFLTRTPFTDLPLGLWAVLNP